MVFVRIKTALLATVGVLATQVLGQQYPDCANGPLSNNTVCDTSASVADRARALINELTPAEKFNLTGSSSPGVPRLGLYFYQWWQEALHGVAESPGVNFSDSGDYSYATSFPLPILLGAAFDDQLVRDVASTISTEARAFNNANRTGLDFWTPNINPIRDPRWGRSLETPGEDTYHIKSYVNALINGLQGDQETLKIVATCKHFVAYDIENWHGNDRYGYDAQVSMQDLSEYYMQPFQQCARDSNVSSIMCSYNALNGVPTCADSYILQDVLRDHWNWEGDGHYVTSDCDSIQNIYVPHDFVGTREQAAAEALVAGCDLSCGTTFPLRLPGAYDEGLFNETIIDQALTRLYSALVRLGYFDPADSNEYRSYTFNDVSTPEAQALALRAAESGMTLLKNDGTLPMNFNSSDGSNITIAIVGSWGNATDEMLGNYAGIPPYTHSPLYALQQLPNVNAIYASFSNFPTTDDWPAGIRAADEADIIIYATGLTTDQESESLDRETVAYGAGQIDVGRQLAAYGKPMIIAQFGTSLDQSEWLANENVSAIIWGGYPGQDGGTALINVITGVTAPAGRLPMTIYPKSYTDTVDMTDMSLRPNKSSGNPGRTYRWYDSPVLPFGYGLHYTNFSTSVSSPNDTSSSGSGSAYNLTSLVSSCNSSAHLDLCPFLSVPISVSNTGQTTSDYVTLGFLTGQYGPQPYPIKTLVGYERLASIAPGEQRTATLNLTLGSLSRFDERGDQRLYPGDYALMIDVGEENGSMGMWNFTIEAGTGGEEGELLDAWPQMPAERGPKLGMMRDVTTQF
jgi:xylan 1,4-beta-xylosidase